MDMLVDQLAEKRMARGTGDISSVLVKIRDAFEVFDCQSSVLKSSYESLRRELDVTNGMLLEKNRALLAKVRELEEMSGRLQCIIESITDGVLVVDGNLRLERCNRAAERLLGLTREQMAGRGYPEIMNGLGDAVALRAAIGEGKSFLDLERHSHGADGEDAVVLASVAPIRGPDGSVIGAVEVLREITGLRRLEAKLEHQKRMASLGQMAASVAHEIRNPLGTIEGFARLLKRDLADQPEHLRLASKIVEGAQNLNYVITNLLTYARPMTLTCEEIDPARLMEEVRDLLAGPAAARRVTLDIALEPVEFRLSGDIRQLRQVLVNLGMNAIEACAGGGRVEIGRAPAGRGSAVIWVADDGCGLSEADQVRLFEPFFTKKPGGTGLGLALCHKIVSAHGGEIRVNSQPGAGSRFEVALRRTGGEA